MVAFGDYYATLGVDHGADDAAIRLAYRKLMRRYHPDVNRSDDAAAQAKAINEAYACLKDPDERAAYDRQRRSAQEQPNYTARPHGPPRRTHWQPSQPFVVQMEPQPTRVKVAIWSLAALVTILSFTFTAATPKAEPVPVAAASDELAKPDLTREPGCQYAEGPCVPIKQSGGAAPR